MPTDLFGENDGKGAVLSPDGVYRYRLWRLWDPDAPIMTWVMLNPSTADATIDDPTIRKCLGFASRNHCGGILIVNLYAFRATNPKELRRCADPVGPENDVHIAEACMAASRIVVAWGRHAEHLRACHVLGLLRGRSLHCLGTNKDHSPKHPLYVPYETALEAF